MGHSNEQHAIQDFDEKTRQRATKLNYNRKYLSKGEIFDSFFFTWVLSCWEIGIILFEYFNIILQYTDEFFTEDDVHKLIWKVQNKIRITYIKVLTYWNYLRSLNMKK